eukprot:8832565-Pyramimonas_sp.AAC.1
MTNPSFISTVGVTLQSSKTTFPPQAQTLGCRSYYNRNRLVTCSLGHDQRATAPLRLQSTKLGVFRKTMSGYVGLDGHGRECPHIRKLESSSIPIIDLQGWLEGDVETQATIQVAVEDCLQRVGFLLIVGHDISPELIASTQRSFQDFFSLRQE